MKVFLDGSPIQLPVGVNSLASIRFHLETLALEQQRILCAIRVDGAQVNLADSLMSHGPFARVEAEAIDVEQMPLRLIQTALQQTAEARHHLQDAVTRVMINNGPNSRHLWWSLANELKHPLVTLSLISDSAVKPTDGGVSVLQLRKWQLQQLGVIMKEVEAVSWSEDCFGLSNALEKRVLPWLAGLERSLELLQEIVLARHDQLQPGAGNSSNQDSPVSFPTAACPRLGQAFGY